jgi:hypothetical protein
LKQRLQRRDAKIKKLSDELKEIKKKNSLIVSRDIARHHYSEFIVSLAADFCVHCRCRLRSSALAIQFLSRRLGWELSQTPSHTSKNWLEKNGYPIYQSSPQEDFSDGYAVILDESMMMGGQKLLLTLGLPASKDNAEALSVGDVQILDRSVKSSWDSASISEVLEQQSAKLGQSPAYAVSDNASTLNKAIREKDYPHLRDVGHSTALVLQHVYEQDDEFKALMHEVSEVKFREVMRPSAYLLPPKQRTTARFMNLSGIVDWAAKIVQVFSKLTEAEQNVFEFLFRYIRLLGE